MSRYDWMDSARCAQSDPDLWHPEAGGTYFAAKKICAGCPVRTECEEHTARLDAESDVIDRHGMWAARTRRQRDTAHANAARQAQHALIERLLERGGTDADAIAAQVGCSSRTVLRVQKALREGAMA